MIALNEVLKDKDKFDKRYKLMGKHHKLDKIALMEQKFIVIDKKKNEARANCNKLCSQVADLINNNKSTQELIREINRLDKQIMHYDKQSKQAMCKINKHLSKLPNLAIDENVLNIPLKTSANPQYTLTQFTQDIKSIAELIEVKRSAKYFLKSVKNQVIKHENLPQCVFTKTKKHQEEIILLLDHNCKAVLENLVLLLKNNARFMIEKSIKSLSPISSKEILVRLCDNSVALIQYVGEYISRDINLKFYDKNIDMTRFVNIIKIKIKCHG